jgi:hypothetical protein
MDWPQSNGIDSPTALDPIQHVRICQNCWNGKHAKRGAKCKEGSCRCACNNRQKNTTKTVEKSNVDDLSKSFGTIDV